MANKTQAFPRLVYDREQQAASCIERAQALTQALRMLECQARQAGLTLSAHAIGVAACASEAESKAAPADTPPPDIDREGAPARASMNEPTTVMGSGTLS